MTSPGKDISSTKKSQRRTRKDSPSLKKSRVRKTRKRDYYGEDPSLFDVSVEQVESANYWINL